MNLEENIIDKYKESAKSLAKKYNINPSEHIIHVMASVMMHRDEVINGGSFAKAICENNLMESIFHADQECLENIKIIVLAKRYGYHHQLGF
jgi:hypothetical protein